jgi:prephenate dehydratase
VSSTSRAADIVSKEAENYSAALASKFAAEYLDLDILTENIEDQADNTTRFLILRNVNPRGMAREPLNETCAMDNAGTVREQSRTCHSAKWKTLISFVVDHNTPGALADALMIFKHYGTNLTSINSRPRGVRPWQYIFLIECERVQSLHDDNTVHKILRDLQRITETCRDLGSWKDKTEVTG